MYALVLTLVVTMSLDFEGPILKRRLSGIAGSIDVKQ